MKAAESDVTSASLEREGEQRMTRQLKHSRWISGAVLVGIVLVRVGPAIAAGATPKSPTLIFADASAVSPTVAVTGFQFADTKSRFGVQFVGDRLAAPRAGAAFAQLTPPGPSQVPPGISILPPPIAAGTSANLTIASSSGFDLSGVSAGQVTIDPSDGVSNINVSAVTASGLTLSFVLASCARGGPRMLTIRTNSATAAAPFQVAALPNVPLIGISPPAVAAGSSSTLTVTSSGCFDLSGVDLGQVSISPSDGISNMAVANQTATQLTLTFSLAAGPAGTRTVTIRSSNATASASFAVSGGQICTPNQECCRRVGGPDSSCTSCAPRGLCPIINCAAPLKCCDVDLAQPSICIQCVPVSRLCQ
jgi:hypothetical protein